MNLKKFTALLLALVMCLSLCACGGDGESKDEESGSTASSGAVSVDGIYVDDSYSDADGSSLRLVYLLYTVNAGSANLRNASTSVSIIINGANTYTGDVQNTASVAQYMRNYECSKYVKDIYVGETMKFVAMYEIPEGDLADGNTVTFSASDITDWESITLSTGDFIHCESGEALAKAADPEGYASAMAAREPADEQTAATVRSSINGYYWSFYVNNIHYELEFAEGDVFQLRTRLGGGATTADGTYTVAKEYIICTYTDTGYKVEVPYEFKDGEISLDTTAAFSVYENN